MAVARSALVTGSASGIGLAIAESLSAKGMHVLLADRSEVVHQIAERLRVRGSVAESFVVDLGEESGVLALAEHARVWAGGCDVLVNNAGINPKRDGGKFPTAEISSADWNMVLRVNLTAPFLLCRELMPGMRRQRWGRVVNIGSRAGRTYMPSATLHYSTTKAGLIGMTRQLAGEFAGDGITVNCVAPGRVDTPLSRRTAPEVTAKLLEGIPAGRGGTTGEIAAVVSFLASDDAGYVTGTCLDANGGSFIG